MHYRLQAILLLVGCALITSCNNGANDNVANRIIAMERAALDRWGKGDVNGYLEIDATDVTYFDPTLEKRIDGLAAFTKYVTPFAGKIGIGSYAMIDPKVQQYGDVAVLTYNLLDNVNKTPDGPANIKMRWN